MCVVLQSRPIGSVFYFFWFCFFGGDSGSLALRSGIEVNVWPVGIAKVSSHCCRELYLDYAMGFWAAVSKPLRIIAWNQREIGDKLTELIARESGPVFRAGLVPRNPVPYDVLPPQQETQRPRYLTMGEL